MDLQRAAVSLYKNPRGKTYEVFVDHAISLLYKAGAKQQEISKLVEGVLADPKLGSKRKSDKLLTYSMMIRP